MPMQSIAPIMSEIPAPDYLSSLNEEQRIAVETTEGPVLVLAGAGTGKTRVLTTRIAHILSMRRAFPGQILAVTFTNKAAREMSERVASLLTATPVAASSGQQVFAPHEQPTAQTTSLPWLGTFHSVAGKILRRHAELIGLSSSYTILDTDDQLRLLKTLLNEMGIDDKTQPAKMFLSIISRWKDEGLTPDRVHAGDGVALSVYRSYQARLKTLNAVDFGDLLLHNLTLFSQFPEVLNEYATRFRYILVDEYQDTNIAQYLWLRLLALGHNNLCCVGDDDQSIYGWRGAEVGNILKFEKDFAGAAVIRLERNYRSTKPILAVASALIANNRTRLGKTLWTGDDDPDALLPRIKSTWDGDEEARYVGDEVEVLQRDRVALSQIAILVRAGFQTRAFEERFITLGIPYRVVGGLRFYERQEIRDVVAYMRVLFQPDDDLAFERIINTPKRGVGKGALEQLHQHARAGNISLYSALLSLLEKNEIKGKLRESLQRFLSDMERWRKLLDSMTLSEVVETLVEESGYREMWLADKSPEAAGRLENLRELVRALTEFETLTDFIEHVGLVSDMAEGNIGDMLSIMTLHSAKGLEFEAVFLPGWEEGLFPHQRALDESGGKGLEEERRLAYVGITRARKRLYISHAANRRIYNQWQSSLPSRFLSELPQQHIDNLAGGVFGQSGRSAAQIKAQMADIMNRYAGTAQHQRTTADILRKHSTTSSAHESGGSYPPGTRIFHMKFGYGRVLAAEGKHLDIEFDKAGRKKVLASYVSKNAP